MESTIKENVDRHVNVVISAMVRPSRIEDYEEWVQGINKATAQCEGYLGGHHAPLTPHPP